MGVHDLEEEIEEKKPILFKDVNDDSQDIVDAIGFILDGKEDLNIDMVMHRVLDKMGYKMRNLEGRPKRAKSRFREELENDWEYGKEKYGVEKNKCECVSPWKYEDETWKKNEEYWERKHKKEDLK